MKIFGMSVGRAALLFGPFLAFGLGFLSNAVVMGLNHGAMPVLAPAGLEFDPSDPFHAAMTASTHLKVLADWIVIRGVGIASPGDFLEWLYAYFGTYAQVIWATLTVNDLLK